MSRAGVWRTEGFDRIAGDNGAWADFQAGREFDEDAYERFLQWATAHGVAFDWLVLPDIVAGGKRSLALSLRYLNRCLAVAPMVLIAVQDGMIPADIEGFLGPNIGIFLGGSTEWKLATAREWGEVSWRPGSYEVDAPGGRRVKKLCHYHFARANSARRLYVAIAVGADSFDGSSASRYAVTLPNLDNAARQFDLFSVGEAVDFA